MNANHALPSLILLDYYDGPKSGYALDLLQGQPCYFEILAWDAGQDARLFAAVPVDGGDLHRLVELLGRAKDNPVASSWTPQWKFSTADDLAEADLLVEKSRARLPDKGYFVYAPAGFRSAQPIARIDAGLSDAVRRAMQGAAPDDLASWQARGVF